MKIAKKDLTRAQKVLKTVVLTRPHRPVLGCVLLQNGYAIATDLEHTLRVALGAPVPGEPAVLVPWTTLRALRGDVEITPVLADPENPKVRVAGTTTATCRLDDFPAVPSGYAGRLESVDMEHLLLHLRRCDITRAHGGNGRVLLTGTAVCSDGCLLSTDGFAAYFADPGPCHEGRALAAVARGEGVLPAPTYSILSAFGWDHAQAGAEVGTATQTSYAGGKKTEIEVPQTRWFFSGANGEAVWLRGLEGRYFGVRELMPKHFPCAVTLRRADLLAACDQAARVAAEPPYDLAFDVGGPVVRVHTKHLGDSFSADLDAEDQVGEPLRLGFNAQALSAALKTIAADEERVRFEFSGVTTLARLKVKGGTYIAMPLQMPEPAVEPSAEVRPAAEVAPPAAGEPAANREPEAVREVQAAEEPAPEPDPLPVAAEQPAPIEEPAESAPVAAAGPELQEPAAAPEPAEVPQAEPTAPEAEAAPPADEDAEDSTEEVVPEPDADDLAALVLAAQAAVAAARRAVARLLAS